MIIIMIIKTIKDFYFTNDFRMVTIVNFFLMMMIIMIIIMITIMITIMVMIMKKMKTFNKLCVWDMRCPTDAARVMM